MASKISQGQPQASTAVVIALPALAPAGAATAASAAYERLRADIIRGELAPGEKLRVQSVSQRYRSGSIPVREALNRLSSESLVAYSNQRGFCVAPISEQDLFELAKTRAWLYEIALRESIANGDAAWEEGVLLAYHRLSKLRRYLTLNPPTPNPDYDKPHREFHTALIRACGSRWMIDICERLFDHAERYRNLSRKVAVMPREDEHKRIVAATLARNADEAVELLNSHVAITADIVMRRDESRAARKRNST